MARRESRAVRVTIQSINDALAPLAKNVHLTKGDGYFYFDGGEAADWLDKTVTVPTLSSVTLEQWLTEYRRLAKLNRELLSTRGASNADGAPRSSTRRRSKKS
jgi:hypothetical protein